MIFQIQDMAFRQSCTNALQKDSKNDFQDCIIIIIIIIIEVTYINVTMINQGDVKKSSKIAIST